MHEHRIVKLLPKPLDMSTTKEESNYLKGRGAQINPANPFHTQHYEDDGLIWNDEDEINALRRTQYIDTHAKTILNKVDSPDIGFGYSMNPYQGCEHGCIYCYARNTHTYWGYSAGIDFEQKILVKKEAPRLLEEKLKKKNWQCIPVMFSGNTDCYQPAEREFKLTRQMLDILWKWRHPAGIITKSALIFRDIDLLAEMAEQGLIHVSISITTLDEKLRQKLEPRTASSQKRIEVVQRLSERGIPVNVMMAPIIPSLTDHEIEPIARLTSEAGALRFNYTMVRLNGDIGAIFKDWLQKNFPDRYNRVIHQIEHCHGGKLNDSRFGIRMRGEGNYADMIRQQVQLMRAKYFNGRVMPKYNLELYERKKNPQGRLF